MPFRYYRINEPEVSVEFMDGEAVAIHFGSGRYFGINLSGAWILAQLRLQAPVERLCEHLSERSMAWGPAELEAFVSQLVEQGLVAPIEYVREPERLELVQEHPPESALPRLDIYQELEELLRLDPIHDVDAAGWPVARGNP